MNFSGGGTTADGGRCLGPEVGVSNRRSASRSGGRCQSSGGPGAPSNRLMRVVMLIDDSDDVKIIVGSQPTAGAAPATAASAAKVSSGV
ncbi:hypothetical protein Hdeb2414_s0012g00392211 [Helianthus debilis subsp. tardiflorus]